jgi:hypothetical protein
MDIDYTGIYGNLNMVGFGLANGMIKLLVGILLFVAIFYAFMLILKIRVLKDTVDITENSIAKLVITANILLTTGASILAFILILL